MAGADKGERIGQEGCRLGIIDKMQPNCDFLNWKPGDFCG